MERRKRKKRENLVSHSKSLFSFLVYSANSSPSTPPFELFFFENTKRCEIEAQMKRSPASSCSSSSSSSSVGFETTPTEKRRPKHPRRNNLKSQQKCNKQNQTTARRSSIHRGVTRFFGQFFFKNCLCIILNEFNFTCICICMSLNCV